VSLVALKHRRLATVNASASTIAAVLDAFWAAVDPTVTTYSDGSTRSFSGAGATGWTWTRYQNAGVTEALYATPPGGTMDQRVIIAGRSAAPTPSPTMIAPDTFASSLSQLLISHQLQAGAFTSWNAATPFTNSRFMGYTRVIPNVTGFTTLACCVYETQETIIVELLVNGTAVHVAFAGALYDPETTAPAAAETDGRRYGVVVCGGQLVTNFLGSAGNGTIWVHGTGAGAGHTYIWRPGVNTVDTGARNWLTTGGQTTAQMTDLAGQYPGQPLFIPAANGWAGRVREMFWSRSMLYHTRVESSPGVISAYGLGWSTTSATGDSMFLKY
jgi:hypothetical protein